jgi:hypothetical protein
MARLSLKATRCAVAESVEGTMTNRRAAPTMRQGWMLRRVLRIHCVWPTILRRIRVLCPMHNADHSDVRFNPRCFNSNFPSPPAIQHAKLTGANSKDSLSSQWKRLRDRPRISQAQWAQSRAPDDENEAEFGRAIEVNEALLKTTTLVHGLPDVEAARSCGARQPRDGPPILPSQGPSASN